MGHGVSPHVPLIWIYISVKAASEKWGISERRIQKLCEENRIDGRMKIKNKQEDSYGI